MHYRSVACFQWTLRACLCPVSASDKKMSGPFSGPFPPKVWLGRIAFSCFKQHSGHDWDWVEVTQTARGSAPQGWWVHMIWTGLLYQSRLHDESINVINVISHATTACILHNMCEERKECSLEEWNRLGEDEIGDLPRPDPLNDDDADSNSNIIRNILAHFLYNDWSPKSCYVNCMVSYLFNFRITIKGINDEPGPFNSSAVFRYWLMSVWKQFHASTFWDAIVKFVMCFILMENRVVF